MPNCPSTNNINAWTDCFGTHTFPGGVIYVGEFKNGKRHGQGTANATKSGNKYVGEWKNNRIYGQGTYTFAKSGNIYVGGFKNGKRHGQGKFTFSNGTVKEGVWKNNNFQSNKKIPGSQDTTKIYRAASGTGFAII